jgi:hypothetical protein
MTYGVAFVATSLPLAAMPLAIRNVTCCIESSSIPLVFAFESIAKNLFRSFGDRWTRRSKLFLSKSPSSPRDASLWHLRNAALQYVAQLVARSPLQYKIIIGDLNTTPWSAQFRRLQKDSLLSNSSNRFSYIPSWSYSNSNLLTRLLSSAYIDHCLISEQLTVMSKEQQSIKGSDHLLIFTELVMLN